MKKQRSFRVRLLASALVFSLTAAGMLMSSPHSVWQAGAIAGIAALVTSVVMTALKLE